MAPGCHDDLMRRVSFAAPLIAYLHTFKVFDRSIFLLIIAANITVK
jgi:hypothetical protein